VVEAVAGGGGSVWRSISGQDQVQAKVRDQ
jgi:hypothetical protein